MLLRELAELSASVGKTRKRTEKVKLLAGLFAGAGGLERGLAALYLSGAVRQSKLGVGWAQLRALGSATAAEEAALTVAEVDSLLGAIAETKGAGSNARRLTLLQSLYARATAEE